MAHFEGNLDVRLIDDGAAQGRGIWELLAPLIFISDVASTTFTVTVGFRTDFESVPRIPVVFDLLGDRASRASALHDALYSGMFPDIPREIADQVLYEAMLVTQVPESDAKLIYEGVRQFGESHWYANISPSSSTS